MYVAKPNPCRAGLVSLPLLVLMLGLPTLCRVWIELGREEDRRERTAVRDLERLAGNVEYLDLNEKSDPDYDRECRGTFDNGYKPRIKPRAVNGYWRWPLPWWSARRWTPAAYVGPEVPFFSRSVANSVTGRDTTRYKDGDEAPMRVVVDVKFGVRIVGGVRIEHITTDAQWEHFCRAFPSARSLEIQCPVKDGQLRFLKYMTNLNYICFVNHGEDQFGKGSFITGEGLDHLRSLPRLRTLYMGNVHLSENGKEALGKLDNLRCLMVVSDTDWADGDNYWRPDTNNDVLAHLGGLTRLENLFVSNVSDAGLVHLRKLPSLHYLHLMQYASPRSGVITNDGIRHLAGLALRELGLAFPEVSDGGVADLARLPDLQKLDLRATRVTDAAIPELQKLKKLRSLDLTHTRFTDAGCRKLFDAMPTLERLGLPDGQHALVRGPGNVIITRELNTPIGSEIGRDLTGLIFAKP